MTTTVRPANNAACYTQSELDEAVAAEREECAKIVEGGVGWHPSPGENVLTYVRESCMLLARDIRAQNADAVEHNREAED